MRSRELSIELPNVHQDGQVSLDENVIGAKAWSHFAAATV